MSHLLLKVFNFGKEHHALIRELFNEHGEFGFVNFAALMPWEQRLHFFDDHDDKYRDHNLHRKIQSKQAHRLYAAIWFAEHELNAHTTQKAKIKAFDIDDFNAYYRTWFVGPDNRPIYPFGNTSEDESNGSLGSLRDDDLSSDEEEDEEGS